MNDYRFTPEAEGRQQCGIRHSRCLLFSCSGIDVVLKGDCQAGERYERFFGLPDERIFQGGLEDWAVERAGNYCGSVKPSIAAGMSSEERAT